MAPNHHAEAPTDRYAALAGVVCKNVDETDDAGDKVTSNLLTGISRSLDKHPRLLESHL